MNVGLEKYRQSGRVGLSPLSGPLVGILASLVLGVIYAYITVYSPIGGYISLLFVLGYGFGVGIATAVAMKIGKCRNTKVAVLMGLLVGLFALYSSWVFFEFALFRHSGLPIEWSNVPGMFRHPRSIWAMACAINQEGWFEISGGTPSGVFLWILWLIEAAIIVALVPICAYGAISDEVFCEPCNRWTDDEQWINLALPDDPDQAARLTQGDIADLDNMSAPSVADYPYVQVHVTRCGMCEKTATYQSKLVSLTTDDKGNEKEDATDITPILVLSPMDYDRLQRLRLAVPNDLPSDDAELPDDTEALDVDVIDDEELEAGGPE